MTIPSFCTPPPLPPPRASTPRICISSLANPSSEPRERYRANELALSIVRPSSAPPIVREQRPVSPPHYYGDTRTWTEYVQSGIFNSTAPKDIGWKIIRYQSILKQLREFCLPMMALLLEVSSEDSWVANLDNLYNDLFLIDLSKEHLGDFTREYLDSLRDAFSLRFVERFRMAIRDLDKMPEGDLKNFLIKLAGFLFTSINLKGECLELMRTFDSLGSSCLERCPVMEEITKPGRPILPEIENLQQHLHAVPLSAKRPVASALASSAIGISGFGFDPLTQSNLPHKLASLQWSLPDGGAKSISILGLGSPTIQDSPSVTEALGAFCDTMIAKTQRCWNKLWSGGPASTVPLSDAAQEATSICPIFRGWMESYRREGLSHLYVVNQDFTGNYTRLEGDERPRINAILGIAAEERFHETLYVVVLSKNTPFFFQVLSYEDEVRLANSANFVSELINQFFNVEPALSGNCIPRKIHDRLPNLRLECASMASAILRVVFDGKEMLTIAERRAFIDIFHDLLVCRLMMGLEVSSVNLSCKDAIDRAAESTARLFKHLMLISDLEDDRDLREKFTIILMARALMVRKRPILEERFERCVHTLTLYLAHKNKLKDLWCEIFGGAKFIPLND